jgi:hypothetical protein
MTNEELRLSGTIHLKNWDALATCYIKGDYLQEKLPRITIAKILEDIWQEGYECGYNAGYVAALEKHES